MASLGQLVIELAANTARLQSDLGKAVGFTERAAAKFKTAFKFAGGGLLGAAIASTVKQSIQFGDEIAKASTKAGIGSKAMSELAYAAKLADVDIASLSNALKKMQVSLSEAGTGAKGPTMALAALGLTIQDIQKRKPEAQFELIADRISKLTDPADRARAAVELFGKAGADLLPLFEQGAAGIAKARAEAEKLGLSFSDDQIKKLADADDSIKRLESSWKGFATTLTAAVAPALSGVLDMFSGMDTRSITRQISDIDAMIARAQSVGFGPGVDSGKAMQGLLAERGRLVGRQELEAIRAAQTGTSGGPQSRGRSSFAIGFSAADAAAKAEDATKKAGEAALKEEEKLAREREDLFAHSDENISAQYFEELDERTQRFIENESLMSEIAREEAEKLAAFRAEQANKLSEGAQLFKESFLNAWDDMVNTGKFSIDKLFTYLIAEFARRGIVKLFDSLFAPKGSGGGGLGGLIDKGLGALGGLFGGGRATGGSVQAGKFYEVGERGRELFAPGMNGAIIPNGGVGTSPVINVTTNVDARGASMDVMKVLPRALEQNRKATIAEVAYLISRRMLPIR